MRLRPLFAAILFSTANIPIVAQSQGVFNTTNTPSTSAPSSFDLGNFSYSLADMGAIQSSGSMNYPGLGQMSWDPGTRPEDLFTVGMLSNFGFQNLSLNQIGGVTGQPVAQGSLASFPLVQTLTVSQLAQAVPGLAQTPISQVPPIAALAQQQGVYGGGGGTVGGMASMIQGPLGQLGGQLTQFGISQIPGLDSTSLSQLPGINSAKISDIPGLDQFPLMNPLSIMDWFVPFDIGYGMSPCSITADCHERNIDNTASGNLSDMSILCLGKDQSCAHIEIRRNFVNPTKNIRWISKEQKVSGGSGLGANICDKEPTGRFPLGPNPKVVLENIKEKEGEIEFALYFSVHVDLDESDSAHCFGPFPMPFFGTAKEKDWILFGPDTVPKDSPFASMGSGGPGGGAGGGGGSYGASCVTSSGSTASTYKGVNIAAFKNAISNVESLGSGGYSAIGIWVDDGAGNQGRGLGKYQFMSYGPARGIIASKPGGQAFLNAVNAGSINTSAIGAQLSGFFTSQEQEALMDDQIRRLADVGTAQGLTGDALLRRMAEMHEGGEGVRAGIDKDYSDSVVADYKKGGCVAGSGIATGKLKWPTKNPYITSGFGYRKAPLAGASTYHGAIDFAGNIGDPVGAADGGVVKFADDAGDCGYMVVIDHKNGDETKYCHLNKIYVTQGAFVSAGQRIGDVGTTGNSTGPHLHFVLKRNGVPIDPTPYLRGQ
jgi:hypothetical protein